MNELITKPVNALDDYNTRIAEIRNADTVTSAVRQRIAQAAIELDQKGNARLHLEIMVEAMTRAISLLWSLDDDGWPANWDRQTGRIFPKMPWTETGWKRWGVRYWESRVLREILIERSRQRRRNEPLFIYNYDNHRWYLNFETYNSLQKSLQWVQKYGPTLAEWRSAVTEYRFLASERMNRKRAKN